MMNRRAGFSLVEVALAIMVIAVGLLSVFGLFPHGMESSRRALDETRAATFAEDTFNSLRVMAQTSDWASLTHRFSIPAPDWWGNTYVWANHPYVLTNIYSNIISNTERVREYALRYRLIVTNTASPRILQARLVIWPGEFGQSTYYSNGMPMNGFLYCTEIYHWGM